MSQGGVSEVLSITAKEQRQRKEQCTVYSVQNRLIWCIRYNVNSTLFHLYHTTCMTCYKYLALTDSFALLHIHLFLNPCIVNESRLWTIN